jgi:transmembrane sensor
MAKNMETQLSIAEQAAQWAGSLDAAGPKEQAAFLAWLKQSAHHVEEFLLASAVYRELDAVDPQRRLNLEAMMAEEPANVVTLNGAKPWSRSVGSRKPYGSRIAAALAALVVSAVLFARWSSSDTYETQVGEQRVFELADGSVIYLNARSHVEVRFSDKGRDIQLTDGEALFKVANDPTRPFRVHSDDAVIQALGTQFNVYRRSSGTTVAVIEGIVRVNRAAEAPTTLAAGEEARIPHAGQFTRVTTADTTRAVAWRQRRLVFREDRLADIAAEFNRYNRAPQIRVEGAELNDRKLTGVFDADAPESLIRFLDGAQGFLVGRDGDNVVIRQRRSQ